MSKTKPDGYTRPDWIEGLRSGWNGLNMYAAPPNHLFEPVCLVPPELLDWIEKVRDAKYIALSYDHYRQYLVSDDLMAELNRIWPRRDK